MSVDEELARKVQEEEQAKAMQIKNKKGFHFEKPAARTTRQLNEREGSSRPYSIYEVRKNMVMYLKNQAGYKQYDKEKGTEKKSGGTRKKTLAKKREGEKQSDQSVKRQKTEYDSEKEELKAYLE
ncbi:hypothetical protein Tco_0751693 [Tanacetum coccineum]|uniref:Uncharacterized protein n=1 Tax=Tanacetum coccineum TaxID=301880 RepID=A0ABQ4Z7Z3_9ASTR